MCIFEDLSASQPSIKPVVIEYEVRVCKQEEYIDMDAMSAQSSSETLCSPPAYEAKPRSTVTVSAPRAKGNLFRRLFSRSPKQPKQELPSYREAELMAAWAKVGIDINDRTHGPRPECTPEELLGAMEGLFGARTQKAA
ncbi:conserved hypothetical protein [Sporisorium reilianum SRZ2]|uniref:Uncharacterized protein n=2 Tax=Sporisorium reilianum TaxID=72558 RepID=E7A082_SPORE|nr:conserved hypothetical protein [Sporisorium reilianum SRZ2]SJX62723.1 uncharacterized protein SRS1_10978 [Sporisorium reilianum f. sp. reilianum]